MNKRTVNYQSVKIVNLLGLHARAAGKLVNLAGQFNAIVTLEKDNQRASTDSVMELMMLTAGPGDTVVIKADGPEAVAAVKAVAELVQDGFGERVVSSKVKPQETDL
ncbi:MAG: HPr family phosphocarrier protein [Alphaproteobacteria bacterium]|jgi:phosphocarrier protein|nr:HPr family phosphocarrier protein [Alphaproteobacteria bacterium]MDF3034607.1 HPr family phosphocarrier protein [Alphaproteobacteria bacterium]